MLNLAGKPERIKEYTGPSLGKRATGFLAVWGKQCEIESSCLSQAAKEMKNVIL